MKKLVKSIFHRIHTGGYSSEPLITISISNQAILENLESFRKMTSHGVVAPVLKSNAYGHGLALVANILEKNAPQSPFFVIDSYFEASALRNEGIRTPLLIIGYTSPETILKNKLANVICTVTSLDTLTKIAKGNKTKIHLKIDTGMKRQGVLIDEIDTAISLIKNSKNITLEGICSHLPDADSVDKSDTSFTRIQIKLWNSIVKKFRAEFPTLTYWHLSNTDGHAFSNEIEANVSRLGIGLYTKPSPVLEMKTIVTGIKKIKTGDKVGYSGTFTAQKDMTIATIPVGYFEGVDRRLSNKGVIKIHKNEKNYFAPICGRVSMNITTIDVSGIEGLSVGDQVIVFSSHKKDANSIEAVAKACDTISYEIFVHIPAHLKRIVG